MNPVDHHNVINAMIQVKYNVKLENPWQHLILRVFPCKKITWVKLLWKSVKLHGNPWRKNPIL